MKANIFGCTFPCVSVLVWLLPIQFEARWSHMNYTEIKKRSKMHLCTAVYQISVCVFVYPSVKRRNCNCSTSAAQLLKGFLFLLLDALFVAAVFTVVVVAACFVLPVLFVLFSRNFNWIFEKNFILNYKHFRAKYLCERIRAWHTCAQWLTSTQSHKCAQFSLHTHMHIFRRSLDGWMRKCISCWWINTSSHHIKQRYV